MNTLRIFKLSLSLTLLIFTSCVPTDQNELIAGNWEFYKFDFDGKLSDIPEEEEKKANEMNRELIISFLPNNKYVSKQKGGLEENNSEGDYKILDGGKLVLVDDTISIIQLDKTFLKLYRDELAPVAIFKKK